jgi:hypothetical protein
MTSEPKGKENFLADAQSPGSNVAAKSSNATLNIRRVEVVSEVRDPLNAYTITAFRRNR